MYKVFIKDKVVKLTDNFDDYRSTFNTLFIHHISKVAIAEGMELLEESDVVTELCIYSQNLEDLWKEFCGAFKMIEAAGGVVLNEGEVLMILKNDHWDLPKGKIDGPETSEQAALREVTEECGLNDLSIFKDLETTYYLYHQDSEMILKKTNWYLMSSGTNGPLKGDESEGIVDVKWINAEEWHDLSSKSYPSVIQILSSFF